MEQKKVDRRVKYTKTLLKNTLVELMQDKHISSISVKELCELADVNRSTFYAHYTDPYDLLKQIEAEVLENLKGYLEKQDFNNNKPLSPQIITRILEYVSENAGMFKALLSENGDYAIQKDIMDLAQIISEQIYIKVDSETSAYIREYGMNGCVSVLQLWLKNGMKQPPAQMSEFIIRIMYDGMASFQ